MRIKGVIKATIWIGENGNVVMWMGNNWRKHFKQEESTLFNDTEMKIEL
jgi:hypothetical protein